MIDKLAMNITGFFVSKNIISEAESDIYVYGFDLIISGLMNIVLVIIAGIILNATWQALLYVAIMVIIRMYTGGYHADTHFMCNVIFLLLFILSIQALNISIAYNLQWVIYIMQCLGALVIVRYAPLENANKELTIKQKVIYKNKSIVLYSSMSIIASLVQAICFTERYNQPLNIYEMGVYINIVLIIISILMVVGMGKENN